MCAENFNRGSEAVSGMRVGQASASSASLR